MPIPHANLCLGSPSETKARFGPLAPAHPRRAKVVSQNSADGNYCCKKCHWRHASQSKSCKKMLCSPDEAFFSKKWRIKNWGWKKGKSWEEEVLHQINWVESNIHPRFQGVLPVQSTHGSTGYLKLTPEQKQKKHLICACCLRVFPLILKLCFVPPRKHNWECAKKFYEYGMQRAPHRPPDEPYPVEEVQDGAVQTCDASG